MKKILISIFALTMLTACGSGLISPMDGGDRMPTKEAVLIGKIELSPTLDDDGEVTKKSNDDMQTVYLTFSSDKTERKPESKYKYVDDGFIGFDSVETNKYFALPIPTESNLNLEELQFVISRKSWFSNTEYVYTTMLRKVHFPIGQKLGAGEVYSLGTIKIDLAQKSFKETGDEEYDEDEVQYIVPKSITLDTNDTDAARAWFKKEFPRANKNIAPAKVGTKVSSDENKFEETQITTTYR